jgi:hypothetical protein
MTDFFSHQSTPFLVREFNCEVMKFFTEAKNVCVKI